MKKPSALTAIEDVLLIDQINFHRAQKRMLEKLAAKESKKAYELETRVKQRLRARKKREVAAKRPKLPTRRISEPYSEIQDTNS